MAVQSQLFPVIYVERRQLDNNNVDATLVRYNNQNWTERLKLKWRSYFEKVLDPPL
jgi:hypothetical protein